MYRPKTKQTDFSLRHRVRNKCFSWIAKHRFLCACFTSRTINVNVEKAYSTNFVAFRRNWTKWRLKQKFYAYKLAARVLLKSVSWTFGRFLSHCKNNAKFFILRNFVLSYEISPYFLSIFVSGRLKTLLNFTHISLKFRKEKEQVRRNYFALFA